MEYPTVTLDVRFNETEPDHWFGYRPGHQLRSVFRYDRADAPDQVLLEDAFRIFNVDLEDLAGDEQSTALRYRVMRLRSLSMGDVVVIERGDTRRAYACAAMGWFPI